MKENEKRSLIFIIPEFESIHISIFENFIVLLGFDRIIFHFKKIISIFHVVYISNQFPSHLFSVYQVGIIHCNDLYQVVLHRNYLLIQFMIQVQENIMNILLNQYLFSLEDIKQLVSFHI